MLEVWMLTSLIWIRYNATGLKQYSFIYLHMYISSVAGLQFIADDQLLFVHWGLTHTLHPPQTGFIASRQTRAKSTACVLESRKINNQLWWRWSWNISGSVEYGNLTSHVRVSQFYISGVKVEVKLKGTFSAFYCLERKGAIILHTHPGETLHPLNQEWCHI